MKKLAMAGGLGVVSFFAGFIGFYLMMPSIAPDVVEETRLQLDSLGLVAYGPADSIRAARTAVAAPADSAGLESHADSLYVDTLRDSLGLAQAQVDVVTQENETLAQQLEDLQKRLATLEARHADATRLSETLAKLEDRQLTAILQDLDTQVLELLYVKASPRNQARLLQAMPPARAAQFVRTLVKAPPVSEATAQHPTAPSMDRGSPDR